MNRKRESSDSAGAYCRMIAVDIGNTAWKFGLFDTKRQKDSGRGVDTAGAELCPDRSPFAFGKMGDFCPHNEKTQVESAYPYSIDDWFDEEPSFKNLSRKLGVILRDGQDERLLWGVASVNAERTKQLRDYLALNRPNDIFREISVGDIPGFNPYKRPETLGVDRFLAATAAARMLPGRRILIADIGTATKIDYVDSDGQFRGGAIFPGPVTAAHALFERTDRLPDIGAMVGHRRAGNEPAGDKPDYPAVETMLAIEAGIYGSLIGAILYFYGRLKKERGELSVILTGRGSIGLESEIERLLRRQGEKEPPERLVRTTRDLILTGIFLTSVALESPKRSYFDSK